MAEKDALSNYQDVIKAGLYTKFTVGKPLTLRVLTTDPIVSETEFTDKKTGEINLSTRYAFIVYNFTDDRAQVMQVGPGIFTRIGELHTDDDFGGDIRSIDIKITSKGEGLERRYTVDALPKATKLTKKMIDEASEINLESSVKDSRGRMSEWAKVGSSGEGLAAAKAQADALRGNDGSDEEQEEPEIPPEKRDVVIEDIGDEPIDLDKIPF